jgi:hypothetical protein
LLFSSLTGIIGHLGGHATRRNIALTLVASLVVVAAAFANAGPGRLPEGRKVVQPPVRFEGLAQYPDHVFYLCYGAVYFGSTLVEVKGTDTI